MLKMLRWLLQEPSACRTSTEEFNGLIQTQREGDEQAERETRERRLGKESPERQRSKRETLREREREKERESE